jgi:hypothetical protein
LELQFLPGQEDYLVAQEGGDDISIEGDAEVTSHDI